MARITRIMDIAFIEWEHALRSGVPRLLERLRHEQSYYTPPRPIVSAPSALSAVSLITQNADGDRPGADGDRPGAHGVNSLSG
jgi:hypothetical protein